ncbi:MAG: nucleotide sugar dehydrogenase [Roseinatronobacter sp.]
MKIAVAGLGYVGLSNAILLARQHQVRALDLNAARVEAVNAGRAPFVDVECSEYLASGLLDLRATMDPVEAYGEADFVIIATPTNYDEATNSFDTRSIEAVARQVQMINPHAVMVIKSTIPVGYTDDLKRKLGCHNILFSPEFLREGRALHDNLFPSRIVVGEVSARGATFAGLLRDAALAPDVPVLLTHATEAEAIKLFANTYLAARVALFNETDTLAMTHGLNAREIIEGLCLDPRIGQGYNNPSFGYGGYCLPKDTKQLQANFADVPQALVGAIVRSNDKRKAAITRAVLARKPRRVGVYRLVMKHGSDNFRQSAIQDIITRLQGEGVEVLIHEPTLRGPQSEFGPLENDLGRFIVACDVILANRASPDLARAGDKVFTRDLFGAD